MAAPVDKKKYRDQIDAARKELDNHAKSKNSNARELLRLAYASQFTIANLDEAKSTTSTDGTKQSTTSTDGTKQSTTSTDGTKQSTTSTDGTKLPAKNNHLKIIETIHNERGITYPDLYQLAGVVAVKALEGPDIEFIPGRADSTIPPDDSCLRDLKLSPEELKKFFQKVKISEPKHIVALYGGLKLQAATSGDQSADLKFDNKCFSDVDKAWPEDKELGDYVTLYAKSNDDFLKEYGDAHKKLSEFGLPLSAFIEAAFIKGASQAQKVITTTMAVGVGVAAAVVIFGVFYLINKRRTQHPSQQFQ